MSEKEIDWKELYREMMADGKYRCKGGTELGEQGKEIARKLQQWAKKLEREQWSDEVRVELDAELRRMYEQLPHSMYRDIIIYAGYTNYCIGISQHIRREQLCQELMKILRQQI